jgi:hypothetical protein
MSTITLRLTKGSALTFQEADDNFSNLNTDKLEALADDSAPTLAADLNTSTYNITSAAASPLQLVANSGVVVDDSGGSPGGGLNIKSGKIFSDTTDGDITITCNGDGILECNVDGDVGLGTIVQHSENVGVSANQGNGTVSGTWTPDPADGPIQYVVSGGNITFNGFDATAPVGSTITFFMDQATAAISPTFTIPAYVLTPSGNGISLTGSGYDLITFTYLVDSTNSGTGYPIYLATEVNNWQ